MTALGLRSQRTALRLLGGHEVSDQAPYERLAQDLQAKLGREGTPRACRANGWAGALAMLLSEEHPGRSAA